MAKAKTIQDPEALEPQGLKAKIKKNPVLSGAIAVVVIAALVFIGCHLYGNYAEGRNNEAATKMAKAQTYFAQGDFDQALNGDKSGNIGFIKVAAQYGSTKSGNLANLYAGLAYYYKGENDNAIKYLEEFTPQDDQMISNNGIAALGNCYAKKGDLDKAVSKLKEAAERASNPVVSPICLVQAGEILIKQNKKEEALKLFEEVKTKYPQSGEAQSIDKYIQLAK